MTLKEFIYKRKSTRKYHSTPLDEKTLQEIQTYFAKLKPLYCDIKVTFNITNKEHMKGLASLHAPHYIIALSENKPGYLVNVGFMLQQMDLYLSSIGLGSCWLGMAQPKQKTPSEEEFVIALEFGNPLESPYRELADFKRKPLDKISNIADNRLEVIRLAPSAMNLQKYYFLTKDNTIHAYCTKAGKLTIKRMAKMREIDLGIAIAHLYIDNSEHFRFFKITNPKEIKGHHYIGSIET